VPKIPHSGRRRGRDPKHVEEYDCRCPSLRPLLRKLVQCLKVVLRPPTSAYVERLHDWIGLHGSMQQLKAIGPTYCKDCHVPVESRPNILHCLCTEFRQSSSFSSPLCFMQMRVGGPSKHNCRRTFPTFKAQYRDEKMHLNTGKE